LQGVDIKMPFWSMTVFMVKCPFLQFQSVVIGVMVASALGGLAGEFLHSTWLHRKGYHE